MTPPNWIEHTGALADRLSLAPRLLVASDFDGTLAPICATPEEVRLPPETRETLLALAALPGVRVALLSGRELPDLRRLADLPENVIFAGNHGLEMHGAGLDFVHPAALEARPLLDAAAVWLKTELSGIPGALVEHKRLTLSAHWRLVSEKDLPAVQNIIAACGEKFPELKRHAGKMVHEFRPEVVWNKGSALSRILKRLGLPAAAAVYAGDDRTDEDAFHAMGAAGISLHVGESPDTLARWSARDPEDAADFFRWLLELRRPGAAL